jgi:hypothetical protein
MAATAWSLAPRAIQGRCLCVIARRSTREADDGRIENVFRLHVMNTDASGAPLFDQRQRDRRASRSLGERVVEVPAASSTTIALSARVEPRTGNKGSNEIFFDVRAEDQDKIAVREKASFFLP